jgi:two-component system, NarL family, sensor histidine kinase DevS
MLGREGNMAKSIKKSSQSVKPPRAKPKKEIESKAAEISRVIHDFEYLLDAVPDATAVIDEEGTIILINTQLENIFAYAREDLIGKPIRILIPERFHKVHPQHRMRYFRNPEVRPMGTGLKLYGRRCDGTEFPVEISLSPLKTPDGMLAIAAIRDITRRIEAERKIRQLAALLTEAEQREQQRISQILHDDLQQRLFAVKAQLSILTTAYNQEDWRTLEAALAEMDGELTESISATRNLSRDLSPIIHPGGDLAEALTKLSTQMQKQYALNVALEMEGVKANLDENLNVVLLQAVRELLFNVVKHAETQQAAVKLELVDGQIRIMVSDEGKGFDSAAVMSDSGTAHGLLNIRQHLELMECGMEIRSSPGNGTHVIIQGPSLG